MVTLPSPPDPAPSDVDRWEGEGGAPARELAQTFRQVVPARPDVCAVLVAAAWPARVAADVAVTLGGRRRWLDGIAAAMRATPPAGGWAAAAVVPAGELGPRRHFQLDRPAAAVPDGGAA